MIGIIGAMEQEVSQVVAAMTNVSVSEIAGMKFNKGKFCNKDVIVVKSGIGKVNAASTLTAIIANYDIKQIVNIGFAGATPNYNIGDKVLVEKCKYHDFDLTFFGYEKGQVPLMPEYYYSNDKKITNIKRGILYTGDYFMKEPISNNFISDMEGAAFFQVAHLYEIPMLSIKVISDIIGKQQQESVYKEFEKKGSLYVEEIYNDLKQQ